jgi:hypothetical protein
MQVRVLKSPKKILLKIPPKAKRIMRSALKSYLMLMMYFQIQIRKLSMIRSGPRSGEVETHLTMDKGHREPAVIITGTNMIPLRRNIPILMTATEIKEKLTPATPTQILTKSRKEVLTTKMNNKGMNTTGPLKILTGKGQTSRKNFGHAGTPESMTVTVNKGRTINGALMTTMTESIASMNRNSTDSKKNTSDNSVNNKSVLGPKMLVLMILHSKL